MNALGRTLLSAVLLAASHAGVAQGAVQERHANGRLSRTSYQDGRELRVLHYYPSGQLRSKGTFRNGLRHGVWEEYAENGMLLTTAYFHEGMRTGTWRFFTAGGACVGDLQFNDGLLVQGNTRDAECTLARSATYR
jgi:antitoxin component YwqK of YwqJK toxin-antitoxin module